MPKTTHYATPLDISGRTWFGGRAVLILVSLTITLLATIIYAGPSFGTVTYRLIVDGGTLLLWLAAATAYGTLLLRFILRVEPGAPPILRIVTAAGLGLGIMSLVILGLGLCGALNVLCAWVLIIGGISVGVALLVRCDTAENRTRIGQWLGQPAGAHWLWLIALPFIVAMTVGAMVPPGFLWSQSEPHPYDVLEYHLQVPREWYEAGRIIPLRHNVFSYFPFNVEMHFLLAMHLRGGPWAGMYLAQFMHGAFVLLSMAAVYGLARWKAPRLAAVLATLAMATVPALARLAPIAYDEGGLLLFGTLAIGWAMRATLEEENRIRRFIVAGLLAGFACGTKLTAVPEILLGIAIIAGTFTTGMAVRRSRSSREVLSGSASRMTGIILFCLVGVLTFSPWLIRNIAWVGNPVFPEAATILGKGHFSDVQVERWRRAHSPQPSQQSLVARLGALRDQVFFDWQYGYVLLPLGFLGFAFAAGRGEARFPAGLMLLLLIIWLCFTHLQGRFFILGVPIGALLVAVGCAEFEKRSGRGVYIVVFTLITIQAIAGAVRLHADLWSRLYDSQVPLARLLGSEDTNWSMPLAYDKIPAGSPIIVIGDANIFWWQIPMSRLRYRTVFDADTSNGIGILDGWAGPPRDRGNAWLLINPYELKRFARTYQPMPPVPDWIARQGNESFAVPPGGVPTK